jgi:lauroyl/myristoyl acyltransferase
VSLRAPPGLRRTRAESWQSAKDTARVAGLFIVAWLPEPLWRPLIAAAVRLASYRLPARRLAKTPQCPAAALPPGSRCSAVARRRTWRTQDWLERLPALRDYRPGGWRPGIRLEGREHVEAALAAGNGAVLWVTSFQYSTMVAKVAFKRAGLLATQLSRPQHGFSGTTFGIRHLNPIRTRREDRYLAGRVVIDKGSEIAAMRKLRRLLVENRLVIITVAREASQRTSVPFFQGTIEIPTAPIGLAASTGAALLPVFCVRHPRGRFVVHIEAPLPARQREPEPAARAYAGLLEEYCRLWPGQWTGWHRRVYRESPSGT